MQVLQLDSNGNPQDWISLEKAAHYYATDSVSWTVGDVFATLRGGVNAYTGQLSKMDLHPIIAVRGASRINLFDAVPTVTRQKVIVRDRLTCAYCGDKKHRWQELTIDHIQPESRGGAWDWCNLIAACPACNSKKAAKTPQEARMDLLFAPYAPSVFEDFLLRGRNIQGDAYDFLIRRVGKHSRLIEQAF